MKHKLKRRKNYGAKSSVATNLFLIFLVVSILLVYLHMRMRPVIEDMAEYQSKIFTTKIVNNSVLEEIEKNEISYDNIIKVTQDNLGTVTSIQTDMIKVNNLKASVTQNIVEKLHNIDKHTITLPLGTLIGNEWFSARGPDINIKIIPQGYVQSELFSKFISAGINQTKHQIILKTTVQMVIVCPGYTVRCSSSTNFIIAETIIVGKIPESFTQIEGDDSPTISKINDYAAE